MRIDFWTIGLQAINALVLVWLLARFLFRPVVAITAQRREATDKLLADATAARLRAEAEAAEITAQRAALNEEMAQARAEAHKLAETERTAELAHARADADAARREAEAAWSRDRVRLQAALEAGAGRLAVDMASRLLARIPAPAVTAALAEQLARDIAALPSNERRLLADDAAELEAVIAAELDPAARQAFIDALARSLDLTPTVTFSTDPSLLAGIELLGPHTLIRNSWRADLERMAHDLATEPAHA